MARFFYKAVASVARVLYDVLYPTRVTGLENFPAEGGFVICANHASARDPLIVASHLPLDRELHFMAKKELFRNRFLGALLRGLNSIPVDRGNTDLSAMRKALEVVKDGEGLMIFPQGTRSRDNSRMPMLNGAAVIVMRCQAPVLPVYIDAPYRLFRRMKLCIGKPMDFSDLGRRADAETLSKVTGRIADAIWGLK